MLITRHATPASLDDPEMWVLRREAELWRQVVVDLFGSDDLGDSAERRWAWSSRPEYADWLRVVAHSESGPVGVGSIEMATQDNLHIAYVSIVVDREHRRRGIGSALYAELADVAAKNGRTNIQGWTYEPLVPIGPNRLRGTEGDGEIDADGPSAGFLIPKGFQLMQVDLMSAVDLPAQDVADSVADEARAATPMDYDLVQWFGPVPDQWRADVADLHRAMSTDIPTGGAELEEEPFDAARVAAYDESSAAAGIERLTCAARHLESGRLVAVSLLSESRARTGWWISGKPSCSRATEAMASACWSRPPTMPRLARIGRTSNDWSLGTHRRTSTCCGSTAGSGTHPLPPRAGSRGRTADVGLSRDAIVDAAMRILDTYGLGDLSMRRVADDLGVQAGALYYHVPNKQSLLAAVADHILAELETPTTADPTAHLTEWASSLRQALLSHRDAAELVASAHALGLGTVDACGGGEAVLAEAGLPEPAATMAALLHFVLGHVTGEQTRAQLHALGVVDTFDAAVAERDFQWGVGLLTRGAAGS